MSTKQELRRTVIAEFNLKYGKNLLNIERCKELQQQLRQEKHNLEKELCLQNCDSKIAKTVKHIEENAQEFQTVRKHADTVLDEISQHMTETDEIRQHIKEYCDQLNVLETTFCYFKVLQRIETLDNELHREIGNGDNEHCATVFANLCDVSRGLINSPAGNLRSHLNRILLFWHNILRDKFSKIFDDILKSIKWPFVNTNFSLQTPSETNIHKLQIITEYLLQIELPEETTSPVIMSGMLSDFPRLSLPVHFLVNPLRKRFLYHFVGMRQTNRIDKPEWYFTQILSWIRDHTDFVKKWIQPVVDKMGLHHIDVKLELMRGLVQLSVEKLYSDLPTLQYDDFTFSHCVDEALGFDKELRENYNYPQSQPSVLGVLTQAQIFIKWLSMEKKYATEKLDLILSSSTTDAFEAVASDIDELKITTCADTFITLLQTITERYESLPQPGHRLQFLELQLELLDDFRVRLLQLVHAEANLDIIESRIPAIANTIYYIENVLIDWGSMLHFLNLFYYKNQLDVATQNPKDFDDIPDYEIESETVFVDILSLYKHMRKDLLCTLAESVVMDVRARSRNYRRELWSSVPLQKDTRGLSLTPSACPMFEILATRLHQLQKSLAGKLFTIIWRSIAQQLDAFFFDEVVLDNRFSEGGALQLKYDVARNLFPLFSQFTEKPDYYFIQLQESCVLLNISKGSALLLRETLLVLEGATGIEDQRGRALKEIGVVNFTPRMAVTVLNQRCDITVNRIAVD